MKIIRFLWRVRMLPWRRLFILGILLAVMVSALMVGSRVYASLRYQDRIYDASSVPARPVAIVLGARVLSSGQPSAMLKDRVAEAAALYFAGKTDVLLMSGDNRFADYNEPETMRQTALQLGVPDSAIVLDYAGRRTYDTCYRAHDIFQVDSAIVVTQAFHLPRALMLCNELGIDAIGVAADVQRPTGYWLPSMISSQMREFPATSMALVDLFTRPMPVLGDPLPIAPTD